VVYSYDCLYHLVQKIDEPFRESLIVIIVYLVITRQRKGAAPSGEKECMIKHSRSMEQTNNELLH
jgi:hypothetical protein